MQYQILPDRIAAVTSPVASGFFPSSSVSPANSTGTPAHDHEPSPDDRCGLEFGNYTCANEPIGKCCSKWGWCGGTYNHCGLGCQAAFGLCGGPAWVLVPSGSVTGRPASVTGPSSYIIPSSMVVPGMVPTPAVSIRLPIPVHVASPVSAPWINATVSMGFPVGTTSRGQTICPTGTASLAPPHSDHRQTYRSEAML